MKATVLAAIAALIIPSSIFAGEGMWMPQQVPLLETQLKADGLEVPAKDFTDLTGFPMGAVISLGGCTASFVSPHGLVVTNHHCAFGSIQQNSTPERDLITDGFLAKTTDEELPAAPGTRVWVTTAIEDVTSRMIGKMDAKLSDRQRHDLLDQRTRFLVAECEKPGGVRCRVASFFEGSQYFRTTALEIRDVRLVYAPANGVGNFGGDIDNFMWPRHTGDWSFYRAYVAKDGKPAEFSKDNVPYQPKQFLKIATSGVNQGDLVVVAGYPGRTFRHITASEYAEQQNFRYPKSISYFEAMIRILEAESAKSRDAKILNAARIEGLANGLKNYQGTLDGMKRGNLIERKQKDEADLRAWIAADPSRAKAYGGVLDTIAKLDAQRSATRERDMLSMWLARSSTLLSQARTLARLAVERRKKDMDREFEYQDRELPRIKSGIARAQKQYEPSSDRASLRYFLKEAAALPQGQRIRAIDDALASTGETSVDAQLDNLIAALYSGTKVDSMDERIKMFAESAEQLKARKDTFLDLAFAMLPEQQEREAREEAFEGAMSRVRPAYMQALREMKGGLLYPDANGTLRVTFGVVEGYKPRDAVSYMPQTSVNGVVAKETGMEPFDSPKALLDAVHEGKADGYVDPQLGAVPVNFLSTCDTTGGNSGSPTLNRKGELAGLLFDGNYESIASDYVFIPDITRSIHVDSLYMLWVMDYVDHAHNLMREMGVEPKSR